MSQHVYTSPTGLYRYTLPAVYLPAAGTSSAYETAFINPADSSTLVCMVKSTNLTPEGVAAFKQAADTTIEKQFFTYVKNPHIRQRGEVARYAAQSVYFYLRHTVSSATGNDYIMHYLFYHRGQEISFIFRTREERLARLQPIVDAVIQSVELL